MPEIESNSVHLIVTSPPYFNAPFDYVGLYKDYDRFLAIMKTVAKEMFRVLEDGRIIAINIDDMLVDGIKYPITADVTKILQEAGFRYRDRIIWKKPDGYLRISRRSGVLLQNPYPMYFYPDNLLESILILQKGNFDYKIIDKEVRQQSMIDVNEFKTQKWFSSLWEFTNVLPSAKLEKGIAAFPDELPKRLIKLFSYKGETVLDPFLGSGTTMKVAMALSRNSIGVELKPELIDVIKTKCRFEDNDFLNNDMYEFSVKLRSE